MGIANPVTRETHGSGTHYHLQLAKQLGDMLQAPLEVGVNFLHATYVPSEKGLEIVYWPAFSSCLNTTLSTNFTLISTKKCPFY